MSQSSFSEKIYTADVAAEALSSLLLSKEFRTHLGRLSTYTLKTGFEGGYAAYEDGTDRLDLPSKSVQKADSQDKIGLEAFASGYENFNPYKLLYGPTDVRTDFEDIQVNTISKHRTDVRLLVHSHPLAPYKPDSFKNELLAPSLADLEGWEELNLEMNNLTEGVLVPSSDKLFLWRKDPAAPHYPYYAQYESQPQRNTLLRVMKESGIRIATVNTHEDNIMYEEEVVDAVRNLYS